MLIGIVGLGVVGSASKFGFEKLGHTVIGHDIKLGTKITDLLSSEIVFISVPTPSLPSGGCDINIVLDVLEELSFVNYKGVVAIRSTIPPGTTERFRDSFNMRICFVPEFLRERCAIADFVENNNILAVGTDDKDIYELVKSCFGHYPKQQVMMSPTEAELLKYFHNSFGALRVVFANEFYEICKKMGAKYNNVKNAFMASSKLPDIYFDVNDNLRGYSSVCWNKDVPALCDLIKKLGLELPVIQGIEAANDRFHKTPLEGTRESY